ncbi:hypothetical protein ACIBL5_14570 [Streptomyces sp. NPDC050516]|uniref:hypothetical protein n=1 Tax=Streptomyces sp. NPDC050516 TaxID=3365621 RepID=UPI0037A760D6
MNSEQLVELVRGLVSVDARKREMVADVVCDWVGSCSRADGTVLAGVLSASASCESDPAALEAQLHALLELGAGGLTDLESIAHLREIDRGKMTESLIEYVDDLLEEL